MAYYARRLAGTAGILLVVSVLAFALLHLAPGDPARVVAGADATDAQVAAVREQLGLGRPVVVQYLSWLGGIFSGNLGTSYILGRPVAELVGQRLGSTLLLVGTAMVLMAVVSAVGGVLLATSRGALRAVIDSVTTVALSIPPFVSSIILIFVFAVIWRVLPSGGEVSVGVDPAQAMRYVLMPAVALALPNAAILARLLATDLRRAMQEEFVLTAQAKGATPVRITWLHALPASLTSWIVQLGINFGNLVGGALVVEAIFARAGVGGLLVDAVTKRDYTTAQSLLLLTVGVAILAQLVAEIVTSRIDPRITVGGTR